VARNGLLPLAGVRVLDCSRVLAGPFATMLLADLGADVIKLEPPGGDESRSWGPPWWGDVADLRSAYFAAVNRNKRSIVVDLRSVPGRDILDRLAARSDLLVHNARPGQAVHLGLDAGRLEEVHPHLVVASVGGFPGGRLEAARPAYDLLAQAVSGLMAVTGHADGPPTKVGVALLDLLAGLELAVGALAAIVGRERFGATKRRVQVDLVEASVAGLINVLGNYLASGEEPDRWGNEHPNIVPYQVFAARDGYLAVAVGNEAQYARLLRTLQLAPDPRFAGNAERVAHRAEVVAWLSPAIAHRGRDELLAALADADVPAGPVNQVSEALAAMEAAHGGRWLEVADGIRLPPDPIRIDGERLPLVSAPPRLGEQTDEVLVEAGLGRDEIADLRRHGVVA
jgi:crotonobetainyl-CoA:carnitine CoA-transferase CaiB-like acyl-CoA transferase